MLPDGSFEGETVTGIHFTQYTIMEKGGIRVQRFEMQDHYHFIVQGEIAYSKSELSMLLAKYLITSPDSV